MRRIRHIVQPVLTREEIPCGLEALVGPDLLAVGKDDFGTAAVGDLEALAPLNSRNNSLGRLPELPHSYPHHWCCL